MESVSNGRRTIVVIPAARTAALVLSVIAAVAVVLLWATVAIFGAFPGDHYLASEIATHRPAADLTAPAHVLAFLGQPVVAVLIALVIAAVAARRISRRHGVLVLSALGASLLTFAIKELVHRGRPPGAHMLDPSFPSGHTTFAAAMLGTTAVLLLQRRRAALAALCALAIAAMGPSRIVLGAHWLSDVLAGYAVGFGWLALMLRTVWPWAQAGAAPQMASAQDLLGGRAAGAPAVDVPHDQQRAGGPGGDRPSMSPASARARQLPDRAHGRAGGVAAVEHDRVALRDRGEV